MMSGCYVYHKWQHIKSKNLSDIIVSSKPKKRLKRFLRRASSSVSTKERTSDLRQMKLEAEGNFTTQVTIPDEEFINHIHMTNLDDDVFDDVFDGVECQPSNKADQAPQCLAANGESLVEKESVPSSKYCSTNL